MKRLTLLKVALPTTLLATLSLLPGENPVGTPVAHAQTAQATVLTPSADASVRSLLPYANDGFSPIVAVSSPTLAGLEISLLQFDQAAIDAALAGGELISATLELSVTSLASEWAGGHVAVHRMVMPWTEDGATWSCADDYYTGPIGDFYNNCVSANRWGFEWWSWDPLPVEQDMTDARHLFASSNDPVTFDVTSDVQAFATGQDNYGWALIGSESLTSDVWVQFGSSESVTPPKLILTVQPPPDPPPSQGPIAVSVPVTEDTFVSELFPDWAREGSTRLKANSDEAPFTKHALLQFSDGDISSAIAEAGLSPSSQLLSARLVVTVKDRWELLNAGHTIDVHRMTQSWTAMGATWHCAVDGDIYNLSPDCVGSNSWVMDAADPAQRPYESVPTDSLQAVTDYGGEMVFDVTSDLEQILDGSITNHGWLIQKPDQPWLGFISFFSVEGGIPARLEIDFLQDPCGNGVVDDGEACDKALDAVCADDCASVTDLPPACIDPDQNGCAPGEICRVLDHAFVQGGPPGVCVPEEPCASAPNTSCGPGGACGPCECESSCADKSCGDDSDDGCDGDCVGFCQPYEPGCQKSSDCPEGYGCGWNVGIRYGFPTDVNVCVPIECLDPVWERTECGTPASKCRECPEASERIPDYRESTCGGCGPSQHCTSSGLCIERTAFESPVAHDAPAPTLVGTLPGSFAVTDNGTASYVVPIEVPPGRAGMQPDLSLHYDSSAGDSRVGRGWSLSGLPAITRCKKTPAQHGEAHGVRGDATDAFCLDGQLLVAVDSSGDYGENGTEYRTELDTFVRVVSYGDEYIEGRYAGPEYFKAWYRDGRILTFGADVRARRSTAPVGQPLTERSLLWNVDRIEDRSGNLITVEYEALRWFDSEDRELYTSENRPRYIRYGGAEDRNSRMIEFIYDDTEASRHPRRYVAGAPITISSPLVRVNTLLASEIVRSYVLTPYRIDDTWLLESITVCGKGGDCLEPTTFSYDLTEASLASPVQAGTLPPIETNFTIVDDWHWDGLSYRYAEYSFGEIGRYVHFHPTVLDLNGDGFDDLIHSYPTDEVNPFLRYHVRASSGGGSGSPLLPPVELRNELGGLLSDGEFRHCLTRDVVDFNEDGTPDIFGTCGVHFGGPSPALEKNAYALVTQPVASGVPSAFELVLADGDAPVRTGWDYSRSSMVDLDGDGRNDIVSCVQWWREEYYGPGGQDPGHLPLEVAEVVWRRNLGGGNFDTLQPLIGADCENAGDYDGDGVADLAVKPAHLLRVVELGDPATVQLTPVKNELHDDQFTLPSMHLDANGDGLRDMVTLKREELRGEGQLVLWLNTASGMRRYSLGPVVPPGIPDIQNLPVQPFFVMDRDNDGREELYLAPVNGGDYWIEHRPIGAAGWTYSASSIPYEIYDHHPDPPVTVPDWQKPILADVNGDGVKDLILRTGTAESSQLQVYSAQSRTRLKLLGVQDGLGKAISVEYDVDANGNKVYTRGTCSPPSASPGAPPPFCVTRVPHPIVSAHEVSGYSGIYADVANPSPETRTVRFEYTYHDGRMDPMGRGWIGFAERTVTEKVTALGSTVMQALYSYDLDAYDPGLRMYWQSKMPQELIEERVTPGNDLTNGPVVNRTRIENTWGLRTAGSGRPFVVKEQVLREEAENGSVLASFIEETDEWDAFGNPQVTTRTWSDSRAERVSREYETGFEEADWLVALPKKVKVEGVAAYSEIWYDHKLLEIDVDYNERGLPEFITRSGEWVTGDANCDEVCDVASGELEPKEQLDIDYDEYGNATRIERLSLVGEVTPARVQIVRYDLENESFHPVSFENGVHGPLGLPATTVWYDPRHGQLSYRQDPDGYWVSESYDHIGRLHERLDAVGRELSVEYAPGAIAGGPIEIRSSGTARPSVTTEYNAFEQMILRRETRVSGQEVRQEFGYDERGRVSVVGVPHFATAASPGQTITEYDELDRVVRQQYPWVRPDGTPDVGFVCHRYVSVASSDISWLFGFGYRSYGTKAHLVDDGPGACAQGNNWVSTVYDARGNVIASVEPTGNAVTHTYGAFDHLLETSINARVGELAPDELRTEIRTDEVGRVLAYKDPDRGVYRYYRNGFGEAFGTVRNGVEIRATEYDGLGRITLSSTNDGTAYVREWDDDGSSNDLTQVGRLIAESVSSPLIGDSRVEVDYHGPGGAVTEVRRRIRGDWYSTGISYNAQGLVESVDYPVTAQSVGTSYDYNEYGQTTAVWDVDRALQRPYWSLGSLDAFGTVREAVYGNEVAVTRTRQPSTGLLARALSIHQPAEGTAVTLQDESYEYDVRSKMTLRNDAVGGVTQEYSYEPRGRLENYWRNGELVDSYFYDILGNLRVSQSRGTLLHDDFDHPNRITGSDSGASFVYDGHGNQVTRVSASGDQQELEYATFGLPYLLDESFASGGSQRTRFEYDATERRTVREIEGSRTTIYVGDIYRIDEREEGVEHTAVILFPDGATLEVVINEAAAVPVRHHYFHLDHQDSVVNVSNEDGEGVDPRSYAPFGGLQSPAATSVVAGFTGHEHEASGGLVNMRGRVYDPATASFLTTDPVVVNDASTSVSRPLEVAESVLGFAGNFGYTAQPSTSGTGSLAALPLGQLSRDARPGPFDLPVLAANHAGVAGLGTTSPSGLHNPFVARLVDRDPIGKLNPYSYVANDPVNRVDRTGKLLDVVVDVGFILYDAGSLINNLANGDTEAAKVDAVALVIDTVAAVVPLVTGGGAAYRGARAADEGIIYLHAGSKRATQGVVKGQQVSGSNTLSPEALKNLGPKGGARNPADQKRLDAQKARRDARRETKSRKQNGQNESGEGFRDKAGAKRGPGGVRPVRPGTRNTRERNRGIDEEHARRQDPHLGQFGRR